MGNILHVPHAICTNAICTTNTVVESCIIYGFSSHIVTTLSARVFDWSNMGHSIQSLVYDQLASHASPQRQVFTSKLLPTIEPTRVIGVTMQDCRTLAQTLIRNHQAEAFCASLPHTYVEENIIHMLILNSYRDNQLWQQAMEDFHPFLDNWMVTDAASPKYIVRDPDALRGCTLTWITDTKPYVQRVAILLLMQLVRKSQFQEQDYLAVCSVNTDHYYVDMMRAWYFATLFEYQPSIIYTMLTESNVELRVKRKTIQKILESRKTHALDREQMKAIRTTLKQQ